MSHQRLLMKSLSISSIIFYISIFYGDLNQISLFKCLNFDNLPAMCDVCSMNIQYFALQKQSVK